jgi:S-sulfosulfanyl-L-cysteine sulfohydrolase
MNISRREFVQLLSAASAAGLPLAVQADKAENSFYDLSRYGNVHLLHMTDCHAQLLPIHYREPNVNLGVGAQQGHLPHLVGEALLKASNIARSSAMAHAFTHLDFERAAYRFGKVGGFAHIATLVKRLKAERPGALLLDGGDSWQGSATALWTKGQDMIDACKLLGVEVMTGHWEFTHGAQRVKEVIEKDFAGKIDFLAQNVKTQDFGDAVFKPYVIKEMNGVSVAIIGQAFPYTPIANPRYFTPDWTFGIQEAELQKVVNDARDKGAQAVVLLSHNGMDVDLKLAGRVTGIDAILGGHTHDGVPIPVIVKNAGGQTIVTNAGSHGKYLGVLDLEVKAKKVTSFRYKLLPVFAKLLPADKAMSELITKVRAPYEAKLSESLATTEGLLYRRGNFNGTWDQLLCDALMQTQNAEISFSPGFRWGSTLLPGQAITCEMLMDQTAITYPYTTLTNMTGETIKAVLEDVADNLFNPDPYYQQGGDMVRVGGMSYTLEPAAKAGSRISNMRLNSKAIEADKTYKVAGWAPVSEAARDAAKEAKTPPVWDLVEGWLKTQRRVSPRVLNTPKLVGIDDNPGKA